MHLTTTLIKEHVWITASRSDLAPTIPVQVQIHVLCTGKFPDMRSSQACFRYWPFPISPRQPCSQLSWALASDARSRSSRSRLIPLALLAYVLVERRRARYAIRFTNLDVLASVLPKSGTAQKRRFIPPLVFALAVAAALIGIARPAVARNVPASRRR